MTWLRRRRGWPRRGGLWAGPDGRDRLAVGETRWQQASRRAGAIRILGVLAATFADAGRALVGAGAALAAVFGHGVGLVGPDAGAVIAEHAAQHAVEWLAPTPAPVFSVRRRVRVVVLVGIRLVLIVGRFVRRDRLLKVVDQFWKAAAERHRHASGKTVGCDLARPVQFDREVGGTEVVGVEQCDGFALRGPVGRGSWDGDLADVHRRVLRAHQRSC